LGSAFSGSDNTKTHGELPYKLDLGLLRNLFALFPDGEIFNSNHSTAPATEADDFVPDDLKKAFPDAASVIFLPLWDTDKSRWIAGLVIWTSRYHFKQQDLEYVRVFSGTIVSELAQIDRAATNKSKDDLLSSVSHELRSPLHGMLANFELLQSTNLDRTQHEMVEMIKTCGNTLLETMNHLLDFAKINNLTNSNSGSGSDAGQIDTLTSNFDIDRLIEDVTEVLYAGHRSRINAPEAGGLYFSTGTRRPSQSAPDNVLSVVVRTEGSHSWRIHSIPGAWRRIIMDLVGNALKFTRSGLIEVSLSQTGKSDNSSRATHAEIKVTDTGCGISREYLQNHIFSPFSQEQVLTEGVGLGLCIAHKLVTYLGGQIDVSSELGVGTQACIRIPIRFADGEQVVGNSGPNDDGTCCAKKVCLVDLNPALPERDRQLPCPEAKRKLAVRDALRSALSYKHGWELSFADDLNDASGDIAVLEQSRLEKLAVTGQLKTTFRSVIVLRSHNVSAFKDLELDGVVNVAYISQPLGPRKITEALQQIAEYDGLTLRSLRNDQPREHSIPIPAAPRLDSPPAVRNSVSYFSATEAGSLHGGLHVLIVDDNDINLKVLSTFMSKIGCSYDTASNGLVAVEKYRQTQQKFDYVLMDISMPIMDGITASRTIREYEDESLLDRCTIMAVTGVASSDMQQQAFAAGMDDYLVKPLSLHDLKRILGVN
jgi:signal transduction histidine kinase/CheY-like chemotaxis protein